MDAASSLRVEPGNDLPATLGPGGHWELNGNVPLVGFRESNADIILGLPVEGERLVGTRSYPSSALNILGAHLWYVNPAETPVQILVVASLAGKTVSSAQWTLPAHGGILWPDIAPGASHRIPGAFVTVHVLNGSIAIGIDK
jgi:hypothetical protein